MQNSTIELRKNVELIGTFFLVLVIGLTVIAPGAGAKAAPAFRLTNPDDSQGRETAQVMHGP